MKKDVKAWAVKLRGRSFRGLNGVPFLYMKKADASIIAMRVGQADGIKAEAIRVRVRIEEIE
jgi:hypothetical protein